MMKFLTLLATAMMLSSVVLALMFSSVVFAQVPSAPECQKLRAKSVGMHADEFDAAASRPRSGEPSLHCKHPRF